MQSKKNKNIDQLFKDHLLGMESSPPPVVWENIQAAMGHNKRDRKVIPLWWKLAGVAAALVILFTITNNFMSDNPNSFLDDNQLVTDKDIITSPEVDHNLTIQDQIQDPLKKDISPEKQDMQHTTVASEEKNVDHEDKKMNNTLKTPVTNMSNRVNNVSVVNTVNKNDYTNNSNTKDVITNKQTIKNTIASSNANTTKNTQKPPFINDNDIRNTEVITGNINEAVVNEEIKDIKEAVEKEILIGKDKESIFDAIEAQKEAVAKTTDDLPADRWAISPNVAPVYYNSISQGSSIDPTFSDNTQKGEVNVSYGINVSYALSPRLTVRSGVSNVNLSYATGGLELATGDASAALQSVTFNNRTGTVVTAVDQGALNNVEPGSTFENLTRKATDGEVFLTQSISYTEIPTELTYALVSKKFGINLIGGFSTLLLGNNEVAVSANDFEDVLGEANNLSDVSFSTNVGLGLSYQLSKKFKFNVEPMFKYQLNPYTDTSVQFKPYYVGVYSGLSFKF